MGKEVVAQHDDGDVHQVVGDENGGQGTLGVFTKGENLTVTLSSSLLQLTQVGRRQREEGNLRAGGKARQQQQQGSKYNSYDGTVFGCHQMHFTEYLLKIVHGVSYGSTSDAVFSCFSDLGVSISILSAQISVTYRR